MSEVNVHVAVGAYQRWQRALETAGHLEANCLREVRRLTGPQRAEYAEQTTQWDAQREAAKARAETIRQG